eukprot:2328059-Amphidinium_carterae.1
MNELNICHYHLVIDRGLRRDNPAEAQHFCGAQPCITPKLQERTPRMCACCECPPMSDFPPFSRFSSICAHSCRSVAILWKAATATLLIIVALVTSSMICKDQSQLRPGDSHLNGCSALCAALGSLAHWHLHSCEC